MRSLYRNLKAFGLSKPHNLIVQNDSIESFSDVEPAGKFDQEYNFSGQLILPGFIECHTHLVHAGSRGFEMEMKFQGESYQEIAKRGGGILSTVKATRDASRDELRKLNQTRIQNFIDQGVTTLEIKSGYGLNLDSEVKMLESIPQDSTIQLIKTFLGAHAKPTEFSTHSEYLQYLAMEVLPVIQKKNLASRVDIFVEKGFFESADSKKYLLAAKALGFDLTVHADQLSLSGGTELACELDAKSADHCIQVSDCEIQKLAKSKTVAVLLPAADLYLKCAYPPARKMLDAGVRVALSTDYNPGTSPTQDLALVGMLARREMKMTLTEVVQAYTQGAAQALGLEKTHGQLKKDYVADFTLWDCEEADLFLKIGDQKPKSVFKSGKQLK